METNNSIYFYKADGIFGYMSNFYKTNFVDNEGIKFCCSEQYLMYWKAKTFEPENTQLLQSILKETKPSKVKALGRSVQNYNEQVWNQIRFGIMINGLRLKFEQNLTIQALLISTENKKLYEASKHDKIWGIGFYAEQAVQVNHKQYGTNLLGQALMVVRKELDDKNKKVLRQL